MKEYNFAAEDKFAEADQMIKDNKITEAMTSLHEIVQDYPDFGKAYNHIGFVYETKFKDLDKAEEAYQKALKISPEYSATYLNYAVVLSTREKYNQLQELLMQAMAVPGMNKSRIMNEYGLMYEIQGEYDKAIEHFRKAIRYTLSDVDLDVYEKSIKRCERKKSI